MIRENWSNGWQFYGYGEEDLRKKEEGRPVRTVCLPHSGFEMALNYPEKRKTGAVCCYRKVFRAEKAWEGRRVFLVLESETADIVVYCNGSRMGESSRRGIPVRAELTKRLKYEAENEIVLQVTGKIEKTIAENARREPEPLTAPGISKEVFLEIRPQIYISSVKIMSYPLDGNRAWMRMDTELCKEKESNGKAEKTAADELTVEYRLYDKKSGEEKFRKRGGFSQVCCVGGMELWEPEHPKLYEAEVVLFQGEQQVEEVSVCFGICDREVREDGFYLNGRKREIYGWKEPLIWPYIGTSAPASLYREEARLLKEEFCIPAAAVTGRNCPREFLECCDETGLFVVCHVPDGQSREELLMHPCVIPADFLEESLDERFPGQTADYVTERSRMFPDGRFHGGVSDPFRNLKPEAWKLAAGQKQCPVLGFAPPYQPESRDTADGSLWIFTNAERLNFYRNGEAVGSWEEPNRQEGSLNRRPLMIWPGEASGELMEKEGYSQTEARRILRLLREVSVYGWECLPFKVRLYAAVLRVLHRVTEEECKRLYQNCIPGNELPETVWKVEAVYQNQWKKTMTFGNADGIFLKVRQEREILETDGSWECSMVRIEAVDEQGGRLTDFTDPIELEASKGIELVGPALITLREGAGGCLIRTLGECKEGVLKIRSLRVGEKILRWRIKKKDPR